MADKWLRLVIRASGGNTGGSAGSPRLGETPLKRPGCAGGAASALGLSPSRFGALCMAMPPLVTHTRWLLEGAEPCRTPNLCLLGWLHQPGAPRAPHWPLTVPIMGSLWLPVPQGVLSATSHRHTAHKGKTPRAKPRGRRQGWGAEPRAHRAQPATSATRRRQDGGFG